MSVWLMQLLCPSRHALGAVAFEGRDGQDAAAEKALIEMGSSLGPCFICGSPPAAWHVETGRTKFATLQDAQPALQACQEAQLATREAIRRWRKGAAN